MPAFPQETLVSGRAYVISYLTAGVYGPIGAHGARAMFLEGLRPQDLPLGGLRAAKSRRHFRLDGKCHRRLLGVLQWARARAYVLIKGYPIEFATGSVENYGT